MSAKLKISIPTPCSQKWDDMDLAKNGRFCAHCEKEVIDFTKFTDQELASWFKKDHDMSCGRFYPNQLNKLFVPKSNFSLKFFKPSLLVASFFAFLSLPKLTLAHAKLDYQTIVYKGTTNSSSPLATEEPDTGLIIKGRAIDDADKQPIAGLIIKIKGGKTVGTTDEKGNFEIRLDKTKLPKKARLEFLFLGYEIKELKLNLKKNKSIFVEMKISQAVLGGLAVTRDRSFIERFKQLFTV